MKKGFVILLAFTYLAISSGVIVNTHYCMGRIAEVVFGLDETGKNCDKCGMKATDGCCHDEVKVVKLADSHSLVQQNVDFVKAPIEFPEHTSFFANSIFVGQPKLVYGIHGPPDIAPTPLHILHSVFRI